MTEPDAGRLQALVMGIGNLLWADEGFGCRAAEAFQQRWRTPPGVEVIDGGTLGGLLLRRIERAERLLVFDCSDFGREPGALAVLEDGAIEPWISCRASLHEMGLRDLLAQARLAGCAPRRIALIGCQPERLEDYGGSLSPRVCGALPQAARLAREILLRWGIALEPRTAEERAAPLAFAALEQRAYEEGRPPPESACRTGDSRFLPREALPHPCRLLDKED